MRIYGKCVNDHVFRTTNVIFLHKNGTYGVLVPIELHEPVHLYAHGIRHGFSIVDSDASLRFGIL